MDLKEVVYDGMDCIQLFLDVAKLHEVPPVCQHLHVRLV